MMLKIVATADIWEGAGFISKMTENSVKIRLTFRVTSSVIGLSTQRRESNPTFWTQTKYANYYATFL